MCSLQGAFLFIDNGPLLESLEHIIEYYSFIPDGLPTFLQIPVPPEPKPPVPEVGEIKKKSENNFKKTVVLNDSSPKAQKYVC